MKEFILTDLGAVESQWIDKNGHMNVTAYMSLFDKATDVLFSKCGIGSPGEDLTMVAARIMIDHRKELLEGDQWKLSSGVVSVNPTYLTITHRLRGATALCAVCDIRCTPFSTKNRSAAVLNESMLRKMDDLVIPGLVDRFDVLQQSPRVGGN